MQDRPTAPELLGAIEEFLRERTKAEADRFLSFQFLVAANSLAILRREWDTGEAFLEEEWEGLDGILGPEPRPASGRELRAGVERRNDSLCDAIGRGAFDGEAAEDRLLRHFESTVANKVRITNPGELA